MAYSVGSRPLIAEARVRGVQSSTETVPPPPENSDFFPCQHHYTNAYTRLHLNTTLMRKTDGLKACESSNKSMLFWISVSIG